MPQIPRVDDFSNRLGAVRNIAFVAYPGVVMLDVCGPYDAFSFASYFLATELGRPAYQLTIIAPLAGPMRTASGLQIVADHCYREFDDPIDTLVVAGGAEGLWRACADPGLLEWIKHTATRARRVASVCSGAFLLAASGVLEGRRVTTHWAFSQRLASSYPAVRVEADQIFIRDGNIYTSGGITAGIDLALALVEEDHGGDIARRVARFMVMFLRRPGGQSQFSTYLRAEVGGRHDIRELKAWILGHPQADLSIEALAERMVMSPRNFARMFVKEIGMTPAKFVEQARLEAARCKLEQTALPIEAIAERCGFGEPERMRRSFRRMLRVSPQDYRARFKSTVLH
ncbi:MAG: GlxA family transcriptional regulator [Chromatiales bacterium]